MQSIRSAVKPHPAPPLTAPTDLSVAQAGAVVKALNGLIADTSALYTRTKSFHWHLFVPDFKEYQELFDDQAIQLFDSLEALTEQVLKVGGTTVKSVLHVAALQQIKDGQGEPVKPLEMIERLLADNQHMVKSQRTAIGVCNAQRDVGSANLLEGFLGESERRVWFLFQTTQIIS